MGLPRLPTPRAQPQMNGRRHEVPEPVLSQDGAATAFQLQVKPRAHRSPRCPPALWDKVLPTHPPLKQEAEPAPSTHSAQMHFTASV